MTVMAKNTVSREYSGNKTFEPNNNRSYFFIVMTSGSGTVSFGKVGTSGETTGEIPLAEGFHYSPGVCPTGEIRVTAVGTFVVHFG